MPASLTTVSDPLTGVFPPYRCFSLPLNNMSIFGCCTEFKDRRTSVALGDTAQLVLLLAQYLNVMLPYPIKLMGSFSQIMDPISCPQAGEVCRYSLYPTGNTVTDFAQAIFLLNQNIQKLLESQKMVSHNSENTLANIDWLLQAIISKPVCLDDLAKISS